MEIEDAAFRDYRARPGRETLRALLNAHQGTVYNLSFQVLGSAPDAEDAAQEALLEVVRGVDSIREPRAFKRWLCRTALHTALDHLKRRRRRARHEQQRAAMIYAAPDPNRDALHEALENLDDDDRCLLVEKYFERATLEEIGLREGVSAAAVGKRIDRAKERLRQRLSQTGLGALVPGIDSLLEASRPPASVPDLVSTLPALEYSLALAGGAVMGIKAVSGTTIAVALLFLALGAGGGYVAGTRRAAGGDLPKSANRETAAKTADFKSGAAPVNAETGGESPLSRKQTAPPGNTASNPLLIRLERFRLWLDAYSREKQIQTPKDVQDWNSAIKQELEGLREMILEDPEAFLAWIVRPEHEKCLGILFDPTRAGNPLWRANREMKFGDFPKALVDGVLGLLQTGSDSVQISMLGFAKEIQEPPASFRPLVQSLLGDANAAVASQAASVLLSPTKPTAAELDAVLRMTEGLQHPQIRWSMFMQLGSVPEAREWLLQSLESDRFSDPPNSHLASALNWWLQPGHSPGAAFEDRAARILTARLDRTSNEGGYMTLLILALNLPVPKSLPLIERAAAGAPTERLRTAARKVLERAKSGEASQSDLRLAFSTAFSESR